ncbi:Mitochondrial import inner membrane translocase subunit tim8 [Didymella pomorum]|uniref:Mitochondrial import inner membrane translocase subunit tim8 n=1 Tax=Didymella pomorum TaxID=749634 RepID=A0A9W9DCB7_9PLEO|nr:Mitochondrial import inner membrane translocase subunit tim8 [Didymella pomorum]
MSVAVINTESEVIMERITEHFNMAAVPPWPGRDFEFAVKGSNPSDDALAEMEAALTLLGSPNGIGAGYFLIQHRRQLGWKYIWKVKIWKGKNAWAEPNILFYVSDHAPIAGPREFDDQLNRLHISQKRKRDLTKAQKEGVVVHKSKDGKNVIREHRMVAKL